MASWVKSRWNHYTTEQLNNVFLVPYNLVLEDITLSSFWKTDRLLHERRVNEYFCGIHANRLLRLNIETMSGKQIADFLPDFSFPVLDMPHSHKTLHSRHE